MSEADQKLASALKELKVQMDEEQSLGEAFSFTKIILKLGTIERMLRRVKVRPPLCVYVFEEQGRQ